MPESSKVKFLSKGLSQEPELSSWERWDISGAIWIMKGKVEKIIRIYIGEMRFYKNIDRNKNILISSLSYCLQTVLLGLSLYYTHS